MNTSPFHESPGEARHSVRAAGWPRKRGAQRTEAPCRSGGFLAWMYCLVLLSVKTLAADAAATIQTKAGEGVPAAKAMTLLVLDALTEKPIPGATIQHFVPNAPAQPAKFITDNTGKVTISLPSFSGPQFWFSIAASHPDYAARSIQWATYMQDNPATLPSEYTVKLGRGVTVGGVLKEESGTPIAEGKVFLNAFYNLARPQRETPILPPAEDLKFGTYFSHFEVTDAQGHWICPHFPEIGGQLHLRAMRPDGSFANFTTWKPDYPDFSMRREMIEMKELLATNVILTLKPGLTVAGIVVDPAGRPIKGAQLAEGYGMNNIEVTSRISTGEDGRFKFENRARREMILTVEAQGYAIHSRVIPIEPAMPEVRVQLGPQRPLRARVLNGDNEPITGADVRVEPYWTKAQILQWEGKTDAEGRFEWAAAPEKPVVLMINSSNYPPRKVSLSSGAVEHLIRIRPENKDLIRITGKVLDAETKQPIDKFIVSNTQEYGNLNLSAEGHKGEFTLEVRSTHFPPGYYPGFKLRVQADGYSAFATDPMEFSEGDRALEITLKKGAGDLSGVVRLPVGKPAANATVLLGTNDRPIFSHEPGQFDRRNAGASAQTDAEGRFSLPAGANEPKNIVVTHEEGFAALTVEQLKGAPEIQLQPWGHIEGTMRIGSQMAARERVYLYSSSGGPDQIFQAYYQAPSDEEGKFEFDKVPPGQWRLYRAPGGQRPGPTIFSHQMAVFVKPDEPTRINYGGIGRPVIGRVEHSDWVSTLDWQWDNHVLKLKSKGSNADPAQPFYEDYATQESFQRAQKAYFAAAGPGVNDQQAQQYKLTFDGDGSFRVDDVPAGTYELAIRVTEPSKDPNARFMWRGDQVKEIGSLQKEVVIPEMAGGRSDEPLDLGTLELKVSPPSGSLPSVTNLEVKNVNGDRLQLADYRGKVVLLTFWGVWSESSKRDLPALKAAYETFSKDARFAMISLSLDENADVPRQFAAAHGLNWTQGYLDEEAKIKVTDAFDVEALPAVFLINAEGKVVSRNLRASGIQKSLERAMSKTK